MTSPTASGSSWMQHIAVGRPKRPLLALLLAPVGAWMAGRLALIPYVTVIRLMEGRQADIFDGVSGFIIGAMLLPIAVALVAVIGLPAHILLLTLKAKRAWAYGLVGFVTGLALLVAAVAPGECGDSTRNLCIEDYGLTDMLGIVVLGAVPGFGGAL